MRFKGIYKDKSSEAKVGILFLLIQGISEVLKSYYASKKGKWPDA